MICGIGCKRLDVVDDRRTCVKTFDRRERRLHSRMTAIPFQRLESSAVSSPQIYAPAPVCVWMSILKLGAENVLAEHPGVACFGEGDVHDVDQIFVLAAGVDVAGVRPERPAGDDHSLDHRVRVALHQVTIFERCRARIRRRCRRRISLSASLSERTTISSRSGIPHRRDRAVRLFFTSSMMSAGDIFSAFFKTL